MKTGVIISCLLAVAYSRYTRPSPNDLSTNALSLSDVIPSKSGNNVEIEPEDSVKIDVCKALHDALDEGHITTVDTLLAAGADSICFNDYSYDYEPPVRGLAENSLYIDASSLSEVMHSKVGINAEIEFENADACKELHDAVEEGLLSRVESLLNAGVEATCLNEPSLLVAAIHNPDSFYKTDLAILQLLLNQTGIDVDAKSEEGLTALHRATFAADLDAVLTLLDAGADVGSIDDDNSTALMTAITSPFNGNKTGIIEVLLEQPNTEIDAKDVEGFTALLYAALEGDINIVETLLDAGADVNSVENNNYTALMKVITSTFTDNKRDVVLALLQHPNIEINAKSDEGNTALHWAAYEGELHIVMTLLIAGTDVNSVGSKNYTSLMMAILSPYTDDKNDVVQTLLIHPGIDVHAKSEEGFTALHYATLEGDLDIVKILLKAGADVNSVDNYNYTALMMAMLSEVIENRIDIVEVLLQQPNIDVDAESVEGYTALDFSRRQGDNNMVTSLLDAKVEILEDAADNTTAEMDNDMVISLLDVKAKMFEDSADNTTAEMVLDGADSMAHDMDNNMLTFILDAAANTTADTDSNDNMVTSLLDADVNTTQKILDISVNTAAVILNADVNTTAETGS